MKNRQKNPAEAGGNRRCQPGETFIVDVLGGRVTTPENFNVWAQTDSDRGVQQLMLEPLWIVEYVTGEVINALAAEGPEYNEDFTKI